MSLSTDDFHAITQLAYLDTDSENRAKLNEQVNAIIEFVQQLQKIDTLNTPPLFHPMDLHQRFRNDEVTEEECIAELAEIAPYFDERLYWVPKVIETEK